LLSKPPDGWLFYQQGIAIKTTRWVAFLSTGYCYQNHPMGGFSINRVLL